MCVISDKTLSEGQSHQVIFRPGNGRNQLACWLALPQRIEPDAPPLVAIHGIKRGAELQASLFAKRATASGRPVIAPVFDTANWLGYQQAFLCGRADLALLDLVLALRVAGIVQSEKLDLFGFSGGAQFVHRFAMLHPDRVSQLSIASPGWYTFPDSASYPYGLWPRPKQPDEWSYRMIADLDRFLALPMNVSVGEKDCLRDKNTRSGVAIDAQQGLHRLDRAKRWVAAVRTAACELKIRPDVSLHVLKGCGHDFETCVTKGGLDRIVIPDGSVQHSVNLCRDTCGARHRQACLMGRNMKPFEFMEAAE